MNHVELFRGKNIKESKTKCVESHVVSLSSLDLANFDDFLAKLVTRKK